MSTDKTRKPITAFIREDECIGCTKCISACPVDAILGSSKKMHTVIVQECIGCGLCVEPCPVDCIDLLPLEAPLYNKDLAKKRFKAAKIRRLEDKIVIEKSYQERKDYILQALARVQEKKS